MARVVVISVLSTIAMNAARPMVAYRALGLGASTFEIGLLAASFSILSVVVALPVGRLADKVGPERIVVVGTGIMAMGILGMALADSIAWLGVAYALAGLGQTILLVAQQATVANQGKRADRDQRYGTYATSLSIGQLIAPALAGFIAGGALYELIGSDPPDVSPEIPVFLVAALTAAVATLIGLPAAFRTPHPPSPPTTDPLEPSVTIMSAAGRMLRRPGMLRAMFVSTIAVSSIDILVAYLPVYGDEHGLSVGLVGLLLSARAGATLVSRVLLAEGLRRLGRQRLLTTGLALAAAGMASLALAPAPGILFVLLILFGLGVGIGQPITVGWVADLSPRAERATAIGIRLTGNRTAMMTLPLALGLLAGTTGVGLVFVVVAALLGTGSVAAGTATVMRRARPAEVPVDDGP
jgi:MFS family permease